MNSLFTNEGIADMKRRIRSLNPESRRLWGKMDHAQMLEHCRKVLATATGDIQVQTPFFVRVIGPMLKKKFLREGKFNRNSPTGSEFKALSPRQLDEERALLLDSLDNFSQAGREGRLAARHPFFGKVSPEEWDALQQMHLNHHLEQFSS